MSESMIEFEDKNSLGSDNHSGVHPKIWKTMTEVNRGHTPSYGTDDISFATQKIFQELFGNEASSYFVFNGTAANVLCLQAMMQSHHAVICSQNSHLWNDECGAVEKHIGCKLLPLPSPQGKITATQVEEQMVRMGDQHYSQPKVVSITQPTEVGTVYSEKEMLALREVCQKHDLRLHIDGARLIYASHFLDLSFKEIAKLSGAQAISFGGTKNGLLFGEAVILLGKDTQKDFKFIRKQHMQLPSKMRFIASQFHRLLDSKQEPLWKEIAAHGHKMALYLEEQIRNIPQLNVTQEVQANSVFVELPKSWVKPLKKDHFFYIWEDNPPQARWMMSFDSQKSDIDAFVKKIHELSEQSHKELNL